MSVAKFRIKPTAQGNLTNNKHMERETRHQHRHLYNKHELPDLCWALRLGKSVNDLFPTLNIFDKNTSSHTGEQRVDGWLAEHVKNLPVIKLLHVILEETPITILDALPYLLGARNSILENTDRIRSGASFSSFNWIGEKQESKGYAEFVAENEDPIDALFWALPAYKPHVPRLCAQRDTRQVFAKPSRFAVFQYQIPVHVHPIIPRTIDIRMIIGFP
ncbi:13086_t:CDS:2 [Acaulospora morrowiae]|uniref:13086_t:CDS:1 n=1 Tax=Acaulospora morrowiae TaxID=94023 RepID=A0A9N9BG19_9GLOM|nr:13086_t:CDS:2 [Acaulospora morrowiae]